MKIIPLNCPNCGVTLEIGEKKEQLACGTCGSQLFVDRSGGAISLELSKSLGAIRTGATQTAAELALVRLKKELKEASSEVRSYERYIEDSPEKVRTLNNYSPKKNIMSELELVSAKRSLETIPESIKMLETEKNQNQMGCGIVIGSAGMLLIVSLLTANYLGSNLWLIPFGFIAFILVVIVFIAADDSEQKRKVRLSDRISDEKRNLERTQERIQNHYTAVKVWEEHTSNLAEAKEKLPEAKVLVAQIEAEIAHNKKIVSLKQ